MMLLLLGLLASLQSGLDAHGRGDYAAAHAALKPLAARGSPVAETLLGGMAARGQGAPANPATAAAWWLRAAQRGYAPAQVALARALAEGRGVTQDIGQAWLWASRAAQAGGEAGGQAEQLAQNLAQDLPESTRKQLKTASEGWKSWP
jgi:TPR repeat protein